MNAPSKGLLPGVMRTDLVSSPSPRDLARDDGAADPARGRSVSLPLVVPDMRKGGD